MSKRLLRVLHVVCFVAGLGAAEVGFWVGDGHLRATPFLVGNVVMLCLLSYAGIAAGFIEGWWKSE